MTSFLETLQIIQKNSSNQLRGESEGKIKEYMDTQPQKFLEECIGLLSNKSIEPEIKQMVLLLLIKAFDNSAQPQLYWPGLPIEAKDAVRMQCLGLLVDPSIIVLKTVGQLIGLIFTLDYGTTSEWASLLKNLGTQVTSVDQLNIVKASIFALQYICQALAKRKVQLRTSEEKSVIISSCVFVLDADEARVPTSVKKVALQALRDSIRFVLDFLRENESAFTGALQAVVLSSKSSDIDLQLLGLQTLVEIGKDAYNCLNRVYMDGIIENLRTLLESQDESLALGFTEFWTVIATRECNFQQPEYVIWNSDGQNSVQKSQGFIKAYHSGLLPILLKNLGRQEIEGDDETSLSVVQSTQNCLWRMFQLLQKDSFKDGVAFIEGCLANDDVDVKCAGLRCYASLVLALTPANATDFVQSSYFPLIEMFSDNTKLNTRILSALIAITQNLPSLYLQEQTGKPIIEKVLNRFKSSPKECKSICLLIQKIATRSTLKSGNNCYFKLQIKNLIEMLLTNSMDPGFQNFPDIILNILSTVFDLLQCVEYSEYQEYMEALLNFLEQVQSMKLGHTESIKEYTFLCINGLLWKLKNMDNDQGLTYLKNETIKQIYDICLKDVTTSNGLTPDALSCIVAIALLVKEDFAQNLGLTLQMTEKALSSQNMQDIKIGMEATGQLISQYGKTKPDFAAGFFNYILEKMRDPHFYSELRMALFNSIGEISLGYAPVLIPKLSELLGMYSMAYDAAITFVASDNAVSQEYGQQFRDSIVESLQDMVHSLFYEDQKDINKDVLANSFTQHLPELNKFFIKTTDAEVLPNMNFVKEIINLVVDIHRVFKDHYPQGFFHLERIHHLVMMLKNSPQPDYKETASYAMQWL